MKRLIAAATLVLTSLAWAAPALAKDFVSDQAGMFSAGTVATLNQKISAFNAGTGKEIVVMTVPSARREHGTGGRAERVLATEHQRRVDLHRQGRS